MTRKEFDSLYLGKAVHCKGETFDKSKELARKFLLLADSVGYEWWGNSNKSLKNCLLWSFGEDTVYYVEETISQGIIDSCKNSHNFEIVEFKSIKSISDNNELIDGLFRFETLFKAKKPDLVDIVLYELGVKPNEKFRITSESKYFEFEEYFIDKNLRVFGVGKDLAGQVNFPNIETLILEPELIKKISKPLLTDAERELLSHFNKLVSVTKTVKRNSPQCLINLEIDNNHFITLHTNLINEKFEGLTLNNKYTPKELGM